MRQYVFGFQQETMILTSIGNFHENGRLTYLEAPSFRRILNTFTFRVENTVKVLGWYWYKKTYI